MLLISAFLFIWSMLILCDLTVCYLKNAFEACILLWLIYCYVSSSVRSDQAQVSKAALSAHVWTRTLGTY